MIDRYFSAPKTLRRLRRGPSGAYIDGFADALTRDGYAPATVVRYLRAAAHMGVFLGRRHKTFADLDDATVCVFRRHLRRCHCPASNGGRNGHHAPFGVQRFQTYLMARGLCPRPIVRDARPPLPALVTEFTAWYQTHRGVTPATVRHDARGATAMLDTLGADVRTWTPQAVRQFLLAAVTGGRSESTQKLITAMRAFLRYLAFRGDARAAFFRFLQHREPAALDQIRRVLAIPFKRRDTRLVPYLTKEEVQALVNAPSPTTRQGLRDRTMRHLTICAGLRVSELTGLRLEDVASQALTIRVRGKGRRERALPLWKTTAAALRAWLAVRGQVPALEVFVNARGQPFSRWGVAHVLTCHGITARGTCASLARKRLSPHVLRHTSAMIVLQATHDIRKVSLWLGHNQLTTTEMYVRADPSEKLEAIEAIVPPRLRQGTFRPTDALLAWLKAPR